MAWQTEVKRLVKKYGCTYQQGKEIRANLQAGVPEQQSVEAVLGKTYTGAVGSVLEDSVLSSSNPVSLIQAAGNLFAAAGGNEARAREALDAYLKLSAAPVAPATPSAPTAAAPAPASGSAQPANGSEAKKP